MATLNSNRFGLLGEEDGDSPQPQVVKTAKQVKTQPPNNKATPVNKGISELSLNSKPTGQQGKSQRLPESERDRRTTHRPERHETRRKREAGWGKPAESETTAKEEGEDRPATENPDAAPVSNEPRRKTFDEYLAESGTVNGVKHVLRKVDNDDGKWGKAAEVVKRNEDAVARRAANANKTQVHVLSVSEHVPSEAARRPRDESRPSRGGRFDDRPPRNPTQNATSTFKPRPQQQQQQQPVQFTEKDFPAL